MNLWILFFFFFLLQKVSEIHEEKKRNNNVKVKLENVIKWYLDGQMTKSWDNE